jgi:hypothetical protein
MRWKLYSTWRGIAGPVLAQTRAVDLLVHDYRVRKFPSETDYCLPSFKEMDEIKWGEITIVELHRKRPPNQHSSPKGPLFSTLERYRFHIASSSGENPFGNRQDMRRSYDRYENI